MLDTTLIANFNFSALLYCTNSHIWFLEPWQVMNDALVFNEGRQIPCLKPSTLLKVKYPASSQVGCFKSSTLLQVKYPASSQVQLNIWFLEPWQVMNDALVFNEGRQIPCLKSSTLLKVKYPA